MQLWFVVRYAEVEVQQLKERLTSLGDPIAFAALRTQHVDRGRLAVEVGEAEESAEAAANPTAKQEAALEEAKTTAEAAQVALDKANLHHAAHALREHLVAGEPCPVCGQGVAHLPDGEKPAALEELERALGKHQGQRAHAQERHIECVKLHSAAEGEWRSKQMELEELDAVLNAAQPLPEVE